jgi:Protein of unknown function (DUF3099).
VARKGRVTRRFRSGQLRGTDPVLITDAPEDPEKELRRREIRYVAMMLTRAACLVGAAIIVAQQPWLWQVWALLCVAGAVLLPWLAVLIANDRPPKKRRAATPPRVVAPQPALERREYKIIDAEE